MSTRGKVTGYVFISYVREDSHRVDQLQQALQAAGIPVWRDTADLWPGEDWRTKIRQAITDNALVFIACFSRASLARHKSYQNEELTLAIEQLRQRRPDDPWLIPVRFDECDIPDLDIGGGRMLTSIQRADLFDSYMDQGIARLIKSVLRILELTADVSHVSADPDNVATSWARMSAEPSYGSQSSPGLARRTGLPKITVGYTTHQLREVGWLNAVSPPESTETQFSLSKLYTTCTVDLRFCGSQTLWASCR